MSTSLRVSRWLVVAALAASPAAALAQETLVGVSTTGSVYTFSSLAPTVPLSTAAITGLNAGDRVLGIDYRPSNGTIVAIGESNQLYTLNPTTGAASPIGTGFTPGLSGSPFTRYGIDINPTVDRVRVVGAGGQNGRLNPVDGTNVQADTNLSYNPPVGFGLPPRAVGVAYTNSVAGAAAGSTREYILDSLNNLLGEVGTQAGGNASFNGGVIASTFGVTLGGLALDFDDNAGFDISGTTGIAYASLNLQSSLAGTSTGIYALDLSNGQAVLLGLSPAGVSFRDITVLPVIPAPGAGLLAALGGAALLRRRR